MASPTYTKRVVVLRKTKLGESDLILTMLSVDGSQLRAVAKGARKPQSSFASRLELYCVADVLNASGRNLDIVKEARLVDGHEILRGDLQRSSAAACIAELIEYLSQKDLAAPRFFDLTCAALSALEEANGNSIIFITAAFMLKAFAFAGLRPTLENCVVCGCELTETPNANQIHFSPTDGGVLCDTCAIRTQNISVESDTIQVSRALLYSTFDRILQLNASSTVGFNVLRLCQQWIYTHVGCNLKSLRFLFTSDIF